MLPSTIARSTVSSISSVTVGSSLPAPVTCDQFSRAPPAGPLFTCTVPDTVNPSSLMPTNAALVRLTCSPVYLLAGTARCAPCTRSSVAIRTLKPIAPCSVAGSTTVAAELLGALNAPPTPANPLAVSDRLSTSALKVATGPAPSSSTTLVCLTRLNVPANSTKPNASSAILPFRIASSTVWSIVSVTVGSSLPAPVTCDQFSRAPPAGPLFTCTVPDTVNPSSLMPTNAALVRLTCSPVYLLAGTARSFTSTRSSVAIGTLKPIAPGSVAGSTTVAVELLGALNAPPTPANPLAVSDRLSTSALKVATGPAPSSSTTLVCLTRLNVPANSTKPNASSAILPFRIASSTVWSIVSVTVSSSLPAPVTCDQSSRAPPAGPLFTCTVPDTVNPSSLMPTNAALVRLTCSPVCIFAGTDDDVTSTRKDFSI